MQKLDAEAEVSSGGKAEASSPPVEEKDGKDGQAQVTRNKWCCFLCRPSIYASFSLYRHNKYSFLTIKLSVKKLHCWKGNWGTKETGIIYL